MNLVFETNMFAFLSTWFYIIVEGAFPSLRPDKMSSEVENEIEGVKEKHIPPAVKEAFSHIKKEEEQKKMVSL